MKGGIAVRNKDLEERVLTAWIGLNGLLKDSQMTQGLTYNEAVTMKLVYDRYRADGEGRTPVQYIIRQTRMLKSQVNRTLNTLCAQGYLVKERDAEDARILFVRPVPDRLVDFLTVHRRSLSIVQAIIHIIGEADAAEFVRICGKLSAAAPELSSI